MTIFTGVNSVWEKTLCSMSHSNRLSATEGVLHKRSRSLRRAKLTFHDGNIYLLSFAGGLTSEICAHGCRCRVCTCQILCLIPGEHQWLTTWFPFMEHMKSHGKADQFRCLIIPVGPGLPKVGDRGHHQFWVN